jgi:hypothetical protein
MLPEQAMPIPAPRSNAQMRLFNESPKGVASFDQTLELGLAGRVGAKNRLARTVAPIRRAFRNDAKECDLVEQPDEDVVGCGGALCYSCRRITKRPISRRSFLDYPFDDERGGRTSAAT